MIGIGKNLKNMTRIQFEEIMKRDGFDSAMSALSEEVDEITDYETLKRFVIGKIKNNENHLALHIWNAVFHSKDVGKEREDWFRYDYTAGTCDKPTQLCSIEDLEKAGLFD